MSVLVVRQGQPTPNQFERLCPDIGVMQAQRLREIADSEYGVDVTESGVAVCSLWRSTETAEAAGFASITVDTRLNEVLYVPNIVDERKRKLPREVLGRAKELIATPPSESVWIADGMLIAGLCDVLDVHRDQPRMPQYCEIRSLPIDIL